MTSFWPAARFERQTKDARAGPSAWMRMTTLPAARQHLVLTIDANLQSIAEQELRQTVETCQPRAARSW